MQSPRNITALEKLGIATVIFRAFGHVFFKAIAGIFKRQRPPFRRYMLYSLFRFVTGHQTVRQAQYGSGTTLGAYKAFCKSTGAKEKTVEIGNGCKGLWIGDPSAKHVFLWYHGGGFVLAAVPQHFHFMADLIKNANSAGAEVAAFFPTYTLADETARYPTQLRQCVEGLDYILKSGRSPSDIVIGGDSAGAQVSLAVLAHISGHPHPSIAPLNLPENQELKALIGLSPWISYRDDYTSVTSKAEYDFVNHSFLTTWSKEFTGGQPPDQYNEPLTADSDWWRGVKAEEILLIGGGDEVLIDSIDEFAAKMKAAIPEKLTYLRVPGMAHDGPIFDRIAGLTDIQDSGRAMEALLKKAFVGQ